MKQWILFDWIFVACIHDMRTRQKQNIRTTYLQENQQLYKIQLSKATLPLI